MTRKRKPANDADAWRPPEQKLPHVRYSKAKARDMTDPRRHGYTARGGPIERRKLDPDDIR